MSKPIESNQQRKAAAQNEKPASQRENSELFVSLRRDLFSKCRIYRLLLLLAIVIVIISYSYHYSKSRPRVFTLVVKEVTFPTDLGPYDNGPFLQSVQVTLGDSAKSTPCSVVLDDSHNNANESEPPHEHVKKNKSCSLIANQKLNRVELNADVSKKPVRSIELSAHQHGNRQPLSCPITLRFEQSTGELLAMTWLSVGSQEECESKATLMLRDPNSIKVNGLSLAGKPVIRFGDLGQEMLEQEMKVELPLASERPVRLELVRRSEGGAGVNLWRAEMKIGTLELVPIGEGSVVHRVGPIDVPQAICDTGPTSHAKFSAGEGESLLLTLVRLTRDGLMLSFEVGSDWELDTGSCHLSSISLRWQAFFMLLASFLSALGFFTWLLEKAWR